MVREVRRADGPLKRGRARPAPETAKEEATRGPATIQVAAVLARARESGLTSSKGGRIAGRVSPELIERAKARTGLRSDTDLVEFALANVAVDDDFARVFRDLKESVDPGLPLGD